MLSFNNVTLRRGARMLFERATFTVYPGWRAGLVGRNGTGKTSLFGMIQGSLAPDTGEVSVPKNLVIATVEQETPALPRPALDYALDGDVELRRLEALLATAEAAHDAARIARLHEQLTTIDGYAARARAAKLLDGLGFSQEAQQRAVAEFSGGWRMRLNLARALMCRSDLLLLDEPTNHLDLDAVIWLQDWLIGYEGTLLCISHDREFLDAVTTHTLHLHGEGITLYTGNYSQFERLRAERMAQQSVQREQQQRQLAHLQAFVDRFRAQATKARQAQSRLKMIERLTLIAPAHADTEFSFSFREPQKLPSPMLRLDRVALGYPSDGAGEPRVILRGVKFGIEPGDRIALLGPNGAGKSTLVKLLAGELLALSGDVRRAPELCVGYFAQHQLDQLDLAASPITHLRRLDGDATEQSLRDYLGSFNFRGDKVYDAITPFSGGEKARLALALVVYPRPNLLVLDEPTNHLDLDMRYALELALQEFKGAMVLVSHDRHMIASTCNDLWRVADGAVAAFDGDLDEYAAWLKSRRVEPKAGKATSSISALASMSVEAKARARSLRTTISKLEAQMAKVQVQVDKIDARLADPTIYEAGNRPEMQTLQLEHASLKNRLNELEEQWIVASEELENL